MLGALVVLVACGTNETSGTDASGDTTAGLDANSMYRRGETGPAGGYVFYVSRTPFPCGEDLAQRCHHLEVAPFADEVARSWSPQTGRREIAAGTVIGSGRRNTMLILSDGPVDPAVSAAAYADAYEHEGYDDWYLPSLDECHELTIARELIGGFTFGVYWTSTERDSETAWYQHFMNSFQFPEPKTALHRVRPIRAF